MFKSVDGGGSWDAVNNGLYGYGIHSLSIDPTSSQTIYAGTDILGLFKSTDGGSSWSAANNGLTVSSVFALAIDPTSNQTIYAGTWGGVFKSSDGGGSWNAVSNLLIEPYSMYVLSLAIDPLSSQTIYFGTYGGGIFKSTNGGSTWRKVSFGLATDYSRYVLALAVDPTSSQTIYAGTYDGVYKTSDGGNSWRAVNGGQIYNTSIMSFAIDPTNSQIIYAAGWGSGLFKSINGGGSWTSINSGLAPPFVYSLAIDPNSQTIFVGTDGGGVFKGRNPIVSGTPATSVNAGTTYRFTPVATDAASFSINNKPSWMSFDNSKGVLTGIPTGADVGTYSNIIISASNSIGTSSLPAFFITVIPSEYKLSISVDPVGAGVISPNTSQLYNSGTVVPIKIIPNKDYTFSSWSGPVASTNSATTTVIISGPTTVTANLTGLPLLNAAIGTTKSGTANARLWSITLTNSGKGVAQSAKVDSLNLTQTFGAACTPVVKTSLPTMGDIAVGASATRNATIDFSTCAATARFTAVVTYSAVNGGGGSKTYVNQFR